MKFAIRMFGLFVAFAGLVAASIAPATTQTLATRHLMTASGPGVTPDLPAPPPCMFDNSCFVSPASTR